MRMYEISKHVVQLAYEKVRANKGAAGVDKQTLEAFEKDLRNNLYKIWNRMSSGSYFPPPVRMVEIPKSDGKVRQLGIPTVSDRVAQMTAKIYLEPLLEPHFHQDSYGYRPNKSAHDAVGTARKRCWKYDWVIDLDIKGFFDNLDHEKMMKAVEKHTECKWLRLYTKRWLQAKVEMPDGHIQERTKGVPQGGVISPLLANLFLHYAFDEWMKRNYSKNPFERYADDIVIHCKTLKEAQLLKTAIETRLRECNLELHPDKTQIVCCRRDNQDGGFPQRQFDFLGHTFRRRLAKDCKGERFVTFLPAMSKKAGKAIRQAVREWKLQSKGSLTLEDIARQVNPMIQGWINYYGKFYKSAMRDVLAYLNRKLARWAMRKYKKLKGNCARSIQWIERVAARQPRMFAHWRIGIRHASGQ